VTRLCLDTSAYSHFKRGQVALRHAGTPLPTNDIWIAAIAAREGVPVLTYDQHFASIARIGARILVAIDRP
jgi:tRNA(fMet)-specific endonuclease VapC